MGIAQMPPNVDTKPAVRTLTSFDAAFNAFHYDVIHHSVVFPYCDLLDNFSWWISQLYMIYLCQVFYTNDIFAFTGVSTTNTQHRYYPRKWNLSATNDFFTTQIVLTLWERRHWKGYAWLSPSVPTARTSPKYTTPPDAFTKYLQQDTVFWRRNIEIRQSADGKPPLTEPVSFAGENWNTKFGFK
uniref:Uncharacterized protein n=1 Tax=Eutreptiella gymnastica TaxID=73025 RepID=A0A7S1I4P3_9EUGL|mmetsp:Transcript_130056/g.224813  ORF Transcript_130056/g.224813 Transcript_130056/m.224813 type:complete len:185 (+) Transcript_130056:58-612(+)